MRQFLWPFSTKNPVSTQGVNVYVPPWGTLHSILICGDSGGNVSVWLFLYV